MLFYHFIYQHPVFILCHRFSCCTGLPFLFKKVHTLHIAALKQFLAISGITATLSLSFGCSFAVEK